MAAILWVSVAQAEGAPARANFTMQYTVHVSHDPRDPATVDVELLGGNEILKVVWREIDPEWFHRFSATGRLLQNDPRQWTWYPDGITGHFRYAVMLNQPRNVKGFDSYHGGSWVLTRTSNLFPIKRFTSRKPVRSLTRVRFQLPQGWQVVTAMRPVTNDTVEARDRGNALTAPYGWVLLGDLDIHRFTVASTEVTVAAPRVMQYSAGPLIDLLRRVLERLAITVHAIPERITVVVGPDPLWRGGLSGEDSLYLNHNLPLIASDYTSTVVHELFHIAQGFRKADEQADWIVEGLAEYYSLRVLREIRELPRSRFVKGIRKFDRQGLWGRNFLSTTQRDVLYNAAPLVMFYIDELIREATKGEATLRTVVKQLGTAESRVSTRTFQDALERVAKAVSWHEVIRRHVIEARPPPYEKYLQRYE